jgi:hypothetical protein
MQKPIDSLDPAMIGSIESVELAFKGKRRANFELALAA